MKLIFSIGFILISTFLAYTQENLVPNGDFEMWDFNYTQDETNPYKPCQWGEFIGVNPLNTSSLLNGVYIIQILEDGSVEMRKVIKQ